MQRIKTSRIDWETTPEPMRGDPCENCDGTGEVMLLRPEFAHPGNPDGECDDQCSVCGGTGITP